jgi:hypothetical protein
MNKDVGFSKQSLQSSISMNAQRIQTKYDDDESTKIAIKTETIKMNEMQIPKLTGSTTDMKNLLHGLNSRF